MGAGRRLGGRGRRRCRYRRGYRRQRRGRQGLRARAVASAGEAPSRSGPGRPPTPRPVHDPPDPRPICRSARRRDNRREPQPRTADDHHFKETTAMSPLQYQKRLRRYEARSLLLRGSRDLGMVAASVGYDKLSQFHREYQRQFGLTPLQDARRLRAAR
ncbi:helix-turn-helix domain-containing protein [Burkholderia gladioli]|uniref:helix-turn-helix domain-containing protein n=1 Tax=Burkholderia gladioli TaxID=28095 RepID=UPI003132983E